ncbi:MAG TPA: hypothetical protein VHN14_35625 [Kofleriaceae bacterium]|nr:hypothetical protein [Kofleriaceae bacterium]
MGDGVGAGCTNGTSGAAEQPLAGYRRREPEHTVLRVLATLGLPCTPATFAPARDTPQAEFWFDDPL